VGEGKTSHYFVLAVLSPNSVYYAADRTFVWSHWYCRRLLDLYRASVSALLAHYLIQTHLSSISIENIMTNGALNYKPTKFVMS